MKAVPLDDNGRGLITRVGELYTTKIINITTTPCDVALPVDVKEVMIHLELGTELLRITGTAPGSTAATLTRDGISWNAPVAAQPDKVICRLTIPAGAANVSVFAWR